MPKRISQREARRLQKQVEFLTRQLANQRSTWRQEYIGTEIGRADIEQTARAVKVARKLGHAVVVVGDDSNTLRFVALPHPSEAVL
jgi:uncharacterized protein (DUF2384 family)